MTEGKNRSWEYIETNRYRCPATPAVTRYWILFLTRLKTLKICKLFHRGGHLFFSLHFLKKKKISNLYIFDRRYNFVEFRKWRDWFFGNRCLVTSGELLGKCSMATKTNSLYSILIRTSPLGRMEAIFHFASEGFQAFLEFFGLSGVRILNRHFAGQAGRGNVLFCWPQITYIDAEASRRKLQLQLWHPHAHSCRSRLLMTTLGVNAFDILWERFCYAGVFGVFKQDKPLFC